MCASRCLPDGAIGKDEVRAVGPFADVAGVEEKVQLLHGGGETHKLQCGGRSRKWSVSCNVGDAETRPIYLVGSKGSPILIQPDLHAQSDRTGRGQVGHLLQAVLADAPDSPAGNATEATNSGKMSLPVGQSAPSVWSIRLS